MKTLRDQRQQEFADKWLERHHGILHLCPRFGKIKTSITIMEALSNPRTLIIYPIETIRKSWEEDLVKWSYTAPQQVSYSTTASLWKLVGQELDYEFIIVDEIHLLSPANIEELKAIMAQLKVPVLGLSGTISDRTEAVLNSQLGLYIVGNYDIETGIRERVITDYKITVIMTHLDNTDKYIVPSKKYPNFKCTELSRYVYLSDKMEQVKQEYLMRKARWERSFEACKTDLERKELLKTKPDLPDDYGLLPIQRMQIFKKSRGKAAVTLKLIERARKNNQRALIFCGTTEIADSLGIPVFHSKAKDLDLRDTFCSGVGQFLATVDMFEAGVTVKPIDVAIINSFDSNPENLAQRISRLTGYEYDNPEKLAKIYIVCTKTVEEQWLEKALEFFDLSKVNYITA